MYNVANGKHIEKKKRETPKVIKLKIRNDPHRRTEERWFDLRGEADTNLYQFSHSLSVQPHKEKDVSRRLRRST